jgi:hypothetical protein
MKANQWVVCSLNRRHNRLTLPVIFASLLFISMNALTPKEISDKASANIHFEAMEMTSSLKIIDKSGNIRTRKVSNITKKFGTTTKTKIRFLSPAEVAGTTILIYDQDKKEDDMWIYMPSMRNTRRIVSSEKGKSFMGSEFTNADMSQPNSDDFTWKLLGTVMLDGKSCYKIESGFVKKENEKTSGYKKRVIWIEADRFLACRVDYYGFDDQIFKTMTIADYRKQPNGKFFAYSMKVENKKNGRKSEIAIEQFKPSSAVNESYFEVNNIEQK